MPDVAERLKDLHEKRAQTWEGSKALFDTVGTRDFTPEETTQWETRNTDLDRFDRNIAELQKEAEREQRAAEARSGVEKLTRADPGKKPDTRDGKRPERTHETAEYSRAFDSFLRGGHPNLDPEERALVRTGGELRERALGTTTGGVGGFLIPQGFYQHLTDAMKFYGGMLSPALLNGVQQDNADPQESTNSAGVTLLETETGQPLPFPTSNDTNNMGARLAENTTITQQDIAFGQVTLGAFTYTSKLVLVPWQLLEDAYFDIPQFIANKAGERLGRILNNELTIGSGGGVMPNGVVNAANSGKVGAIGQTTTVIYDDMIDTEMAVDPAYRPRGKYMFHDNTLRVLRKLKDSQGHPLWEPSLTAGVPSIFNGRSYVINNDMPVPAANAKSILFGDFSQYAVRMVGTGSLVRLEERYADNLQTGFFVWLRADGNLIDAGTHPIAFYANSAT